MSSNKLLGSIIRRWLFTEKNPSNDLGILKNILIVRQHNQLGDMLASVSFFRAIKGKYPQARITLITSPANYPAITKNRYIDECFVYDKKKLISLFYLIKTLRLLRRDYDVAIVPVTVSISFTSNLLARFSKAHTRIGIEELNGKRNEYDYFFDRRVIMDWSKYPDQNVSDFCLDMLRPFGIDTNDFSSEISYDVNDEECADKFISKLKLSKDELLVGVHVGAGKPPNRWALDNYDSLMQKLKKRYKVKFYLTGSNADLPEIEYLKKKPGFNAELFLNRQIPEVAALISKSHLFITNDTGIMHVAGATETPQISIFGPTNPYNWAPVGMNKKFIRKSDLINDVSVDDVYEYCEKLLEETISQRLAS